MPAGLRPYLEPPWACSEYRYVLWLADLDGSFYRPILLLAAPGLGPIPPGLGAVLQAALVVFAVLGLLGVLPRVSAAVCAAIYLYSVAQVYSFTNVHHGDSLLGLTLVALALGPSSDALSLTALARRSGGTSGGLSTPVSGWPVRLVRVQIAATYFLAGYAKLALSGPNWADGTSLQHYLLVRGAPSGIWLAAHPGVCAVLAATSLFWELTFPVVLVWPWLRWLYVPAGLAFHIVSQYVLGVGFAYFWPLLLVFAEPLPIARWLAANVWPRGRLAQRIGVRP
jgi:hypothetical protein